MNEIDITGSEGNAFMLIMQAKNLAKQLDMDAKAIADEMKAGDYEHLLDVFEKHFGSHVELVGRDDD